MNKYCFSIAVIKEISTETHIKTKYVHACGVVEARNKDGALEEIHKISKKAFPVSEYRDHSCIVNDIYPITSENFQSLWSK